MIKKEEEEKNNVQICPMIRKEEEERDNVRLTRDPPPHTQSLVRFSSLTLPIHVSWGKEPQKQLSHVSTLAFLQCHLLIST